MYLVGLVDPNSAISVKVCANGYLSVSIAIEQELDKWKKKNSFYRTVCLNLYQLNFSGTQFSVLGLLPSLDYFYFLNGH